jgi:hypothetical protein
MSGRTERVERLVSKFEQDKGALYRADGESVYGPEEHRERMDTLVSGLREAVESEIAAVQEQASEYEQEALSLSYVDPTNGLSSTERERFSTARPLVREDCESMPLRTLAGQLRAVAVGSDKVPKLLHARYAAKRVQEENDRLAQLARDGAGEAALATDSLALRELREAVSELESQTRDEQRTRRQAEAAEAAHGQRRLAFELRRKLTEADGGAQSAREAQRAVSRL